MATRFSMAAALRRWREGPSGLGPALGRGDGEGGPVRPGPGSRRCPVGAVGGGSPPPKSPAGWRPPPLLLPGADRGWAGGGGRGQQEPPTRSGDGLQRAGEVALRQEDLILSLRPALKHLCLERKYLVVRSSSS